METNNGYSPTAAPSDAHNARTTITTLSDDEGASPRRVALTYATISLLLFATSLSNVTTGWTRYAIPILAIVGLITVTTAIVRDQQRRTGVTPKSLDHSDWRALLGPGSLMAVAIVAYCASLPLVDLYDANPWIVVGAGAVAALLLFASGIWGDRHRRRHAQTWQNNECAPFDTQPKP